MTCRKQRYPTRQAAVTAAHNTRRRLLDVGRWLAYRCRSCRYPGGKRAWHWGHLNRGRAT